MLSHGSRLGAYVITELLGKGGMGEVYRARDTKLDRELAIKVLPEEFSQDAERLKRFEREAKLLASLNHPNIATLYGHEEADGHRFLTMELIEGEPLADLLERRPLAFKDAQALFVQIADGLAAAHAKGVIHRDLKPANIQITPDGTPKILDFGLAKAAAREVQSESPTVARETKAGIVLGTPAYMSPEQARGEALDKRTDIWSFGCCLFEALTGQLPFRGKTVSDAIAAILERDPDWNVVPTSTPRDAVRVLKRCLSKSLKHRMQDVGDARNELSEAEADGRPNRSPIRSHPSALAWTAAAVATVVALFLMLRTDAPEPSTVRFELSIPESRGLEYGPQTTISPDGKLLAYVAGPSQASSQIYVRSIDAFDSTPVAGSEGGRIPFFSHDSESIGFTANGQTKRVPVGGGPGQTIYDGMVEHGASWGPNDRIVFQPWLEPGLRWVLATGGEAHQLTEVDESAGEESHRWPVILPNGDDVLFSVIPSDNDIAKASIEVVSMRTGERRVVLEGGYHAQYLSGFLVFASPTSLVAAPFDLGELAVTADAVPIPQSVEMRSTPQLMQFFYTVSRDGTLAYEPSVSDQNELVWVDEDGSQERLPLPPRNYRFPRLSPDGERVAVWIQEASSDIWLYELASEKLSRFTLEGFNLLPVWSPDGAWIAFSSDRLGYNNIFAKLADGSAPAIQLTSASSSHTAHSWTPDGPSVAYLEYASSKWGLWLVSTEQPLEPTSLGPGYTPVFSADGKWLAYGDTVSGTDEVFVRPYPGTGGRWQVSVAGGDSPLWSKDGGTLYYRHDRNIMAVDVNTESTFTYGKPRMVLEVNAPLVLEPPRANYDIAPEGERFLMVRSLARPEARIRVVVNWLQELERLVANDD